MSTSKVIFFETNEVPFAVLDAYAQRHPRSEIARLLADSKQYHAVCEDQIELDPWISWPTLHRGVNDEHHQILHLGQSLEYANKHYPPVWELLAGAGVKVGIMGSLHTSTLPSRLDNYGFYVPDFFANASFAHPKSLESFQNFNLTMTRKSGRNVDAHIPLRESLNFLGSYLSSAMTLSTAYATARQLLTERLRKHLKCRRRSIQPLISLDIFLQQMKRELPAFATFHTNHVAAAMHRYWEACFPADVPDGRMPKEWRAKFKNEIDYSVGVLDGMVRRLRKFAKKNGYLLLVSGSMGQAAVKADITKGFTSIIDLSRFLRRLGLKEGEWTQRFTMAPCLAFTVAADKADFFEQQLKTLGYGDKHMQASKREIPPLSYGRTDDSFHLYVYFENFQGEPTAQLNGEAVSFDDLGWGFHRHEDDVACSARHTPAGMLLVCDPEQTVKTQKRSTISTLDIAPTLLQHFGVKAPAYMNPGDQKLFDVNSVGVKRRFRYEGGGVEKPVKVLDREDAIAA